MSDVQIGYSIRNMVVIADTTKSYRLYVPTTSTTDYITIDPDQVVIVGSVVYAKVTASLGIPKTIMDTVSAPVDGSTIPALDLYYKSGYWYKKIGYDIT